jgi:integrase
MGASLATVEIQLPKYVVRDQDRHGNDRFYVRRKDYPKVRLRETPGTEAFQKEVAAALAGLTGTVAEPGTFAALCHAYYVSKTFKALDKSTQNWRRRALDVICAADGAKRVANMQPKHIRALRNDLEDKPGLANRRLDALKALFKWAVDHEEADNNPAREISPLSHHDKGFHTWTIEEVEQFEARHPLGTRARLAMALMLYTAGRREDATRLGAQHIYTTASGAKRVRFTQAKNEHRKPVSIDVPLHPDLAAAIAAMPPPVIPKGQPRPLTFLVTEHGHSFKPAGFGNWFRLRCIEAGVPGRAHGLRKALLTRLAERGATPHEIQSWSGHSKLDEVELYTRAANRADMADAGLAKLQRAGTKAE